jgi:hypothetical protein
MKIQRSFGLILGFSLGLAIPAIFGPPVCAGVAGRESVPPVPAAAVLPASAELAATGPGLARLFDRFSVTEGSVFGRSAPVSEWEETLGFNPLSLSAWTERGIDIRRPTGLGLGDWMPRPDGGMDFAGLLCLPATDLETARSAAREMAKRAFPDAVFAEEPPFFRFSSVARGIEGAVGERDGHLLLAFGRGRSAMPLIRAAREGAAPLAETEIRRIASARMGAKDDLLLLADLEPLRLRLDAAEAGDRREDREGGQKDDRSRTGSLSDRLVRYARAYRGVAAWMDLDAADLAIRWLATPRENSPARELTGEVRRGREPLLAVPSPPLLLSLGSLDPAAYLETLRSGMDPEARTAFEARLAAWGADFGIDLERDAIGNLTGGFGFGVFDGIGLNMANYNTLVSFGVKDEAAARRTLAAAARHLADSGGLAVSSGSSPGRIGETEVVTIDFLGFLRIVAGVADGRFLLSVGERMFREALAGGEPPAAPDPAVAEALGNAPAVFFLDVDELIKAGRNFAFLLTRFNRGRPVDDRTTEPLRNFRYVLSAAAPADGDLLTGEFRVATRFSEPFFEGLRKVADALIESRGGPDAPAPTDPSSPARSE